METVEHGIRITHVEILLFQPKSRHLGFATITFNDEFSISDFAIFSRPTGGIKVGFPVKTLSNGHKLGIFNSLNDEIKGLIEDAVREKYEDLMACGIPEAER